MRRFKTVLLLGFLALLIVPVLVTHIAKPERRSFDWVELKDTSYQEIGLRQGGQIAPLVADRTQDIAFVVSVVGGAIPIHDLLVYEENHNLRGLGILPGLSNLLAYPASWSIIKVRQKAFWDAIGNFDPAPFWQRLSVASLVMYGENDTNVPSSRSAAVLRSLANPNIDVRIYEGSGHALESPEGKGRSIFREDALRDIRDFIKSLTTRSSQPVASPFRAEALPVPTE